MIKFNIEPLVDALVKGMELITDLLWSLAFLQGFHLRSGTILVGSADMDTLISPDSTVSREDVSRKNASNDVSQVRHIVHVG